MSANGRHNADAALLAALAAGLTYAEAGAAAGISERTARRRVADEEFHAQLTDARAALLDRAIGQASDAAAAAVVALRSLLGSESETTRISAARALLQFVSQRRLDPIGDALRGASSISRADLQEIVGKVIDEALHRLPEEKHEEFILAVKRIAAAR